MQVAEGVHKAGVQVFGKALPFLVGEAGVAPVGLGIFQVDLLMGHVQVPTGDDGLGLCQIGQMGAEGFIPLQAEINAL